ncbi:RnfABCDGE type electron transport complex subunit B [bacterium]|nr:RnfABCDGE type electron transport complex subunit B [bacterium]
MQSSTLLPLIILGGLGLLFSVGLAYASKKFAVQENPRLSQILDVLAGVNCGACGYPGCRAFAEAVVKGETAIDGCTPGGAESTSQIARIMRTETESAEYISMVAVVRCRGGRKEAGELFRYQGLQDCDAAQLVAGGSKACPYGCLGLGTCVQACFFEALSMGDNGLPVVDDKRCTGCGLCVSACPRKIIQLIPRSAQIYLACVSQDKGKAVKTVCSVGCIGCGLCFKPKVSPSGTITMDGNLPTIDYAKSGTDLVVAVHKCPTHSFVDKIVHRPKVSIDSKCDGCGVCKEACPVNAIEGEKGQRHKAIIDKCIGCGICVTKCPLGAISIVGALGYMEER